jgi:ribosomal protein S3
MERALIFFALIVLLILLDIFAEYKGWWDTKYKKDADSDDPNKTFKHQIINFYEDNWKLPKKVSKTLPDMVVRIEEDKIVICVENHVKGFLIGRNGYRIKKLKYHLDKNVSLVSKNEENNVTI